jgi:hypothetical protein
MPTSISLAPMSSLAHTIVTAAAVAAAEQSQGGQDAALAALSADTLRLLTASCAEARALITTSAAQRDGREMLWRVMRNVQDWLAVGGGTAMAVCSTTAADTTADRAGKQLCMHETDIWP